MCPAFRLGGHLGQRMGSGPQDIAWRSVHPIARCGGSFFPFCLDGSSELILDDEHVTTPAKKRKKHVQSSACKNTVDERCFVVSTFFA